LNDLDKQIAAAKGWRPPTMAEFERLIKTQEKGWMFPFPPEFLVKLDFPEAPPWHITDAKDCRWSTSDSKALELVDELVDIKGPRLFFSLNLLSETPSARWLAQFTHETRGVGATRPEAICRAWLAAMTWMKERKA
jgi:hypothetical protein